MRRFALPGFITLVVIALLVVLAYGVAHNKTSTALIGEVQRGLTPAAPKYDDALPLLNSRRHESLADLRGKVVVLNMFASWCQPCQAEAPLMEKIQELLARHGGTVLGVTYQDNATDDMAFARQYHLTYPIVRDVSGNFASAYGVDGIPDTFVINRSGRVVAVNDYQLTQSWVSQTLPRLLTESS